MVADGIAADAIAAFLGEAPPPPTSAAQPPAHGASSRETALGSSEKAVAPGGKAASAADRAAAHAARVIALRAEQVTLAATSPSPPPLAEHADYQKYFKMAKFGLPRETIAHKMGAEGADPIALELDASLPAPPGLFIRPDASNAGAAQALPPPAKRRLRKKIFWDAIPAERVAHGETIWGAAGVSAAGDDDDDDDDEFEALFTADPAVEAANRARVGGGAASAVNEKGTVSLIEGKRARNVGIGLATLRLPPAMIRTCLLTLSHAPPHVTGEAPPPPELSAEACIVLEELLPTAEEIACVRAYRGDTSRLGEAERFFLAVSDVPKAAQRARALAMQKTYDARAGEARARASTLAAAADEVRTSARLPRVLDAVLKLGNKLNDSAGGAARAITLNSLLKLSQTKAFDGRTTVLAFLVSKLSRSDADALDVGLDVPRAAGAARIDPRVLRDDVGALGKELAAVERLVRDDARATASSSTASRGVAAAPPVVSPTASSAGASETDSLQACDGSASAQSEDAARAGGSKSAREGTARAGERERIADFAARAQADLAALSAEVEASSAAFSRLLEFFGEDPALSTDGFFSTLATFARTLHKTRMELAEQEARAAREARKGDAEKERRAGAATPAPSKHGRGSVAATPAVAIATPSAAPASTPVATAVVPIPMPPLQTAEVAAPKPETAAPPPDPRAALLAMLKKRAPPEPLEAIAAPALAAEEMPPRPPTTTPVPASHENEPTPDPRAALMAMLKRRAPPPD